MIGKCNLARIGQNTSKCWMLSWMQEAFFIAGTLIWDLHYLCPSRFSLEQGQICCWLLSILLHLVCVSWFSSGRLVWPSQLIVAFCHLLLPFASPCTRHDVRRVAKVAFKMADWLMATSHWLLMKLISPFPSVSLSLSMCLSEWIHCTVWLQTWIYQWI